MRPGCMRETETINGNGLSMELQKTSQIPSRSCLRVIQNGGVSIEPRQGIPKNLSSQVLDSSNSALVIGF